MAFELKEGQGSLFRNTKKSKDSQPEYQGECKINGVKYRIAGWMKESKTGTKWMSLSVKPDEGKKDPSVPF